MKTPSFTEKAIQYMQEFHERDPLYFQSKSNQRQARQSFIELYKLDQKKGEDIWNHAFQKFLRKNKLKKGDFLKTRFRRPQVSEFKAKITPKPQGKIPEPSLVEIVNIETQSKPQLIENKVQNESIDQKAVESALEGIWALVKLLWPVESLSEQEKEILGKLWLTPFRRYLNENWMYFGLPLILTIGIFTKHFREASEKKKKKEFDEKALEYNESKILVN